MLGARCSHYLYSYRVTVCAHHRSITFSLILLSRCAHNPMYMTMCFILLWKYIRIIDTYIRHQISIIFDTLVAHINWHHTKSDEKNRKVYSFHCWRSRWHVRHDPHTHTHIHQNYFQEVECGKNRDRNRLDAFLFTLCVTPNDARTNATFCCRVTDRSSYICQVRNNSMSSFRSWFCTILKYVLGFPFRQLLSILATPCGVRTTINVYCCCCYCRSQLLWVHIAIPLFNAGADATGAQWRTRPYLCSVISATMYVTKLKWAVGTFHMSKHTLYQILKFFSGM